MGMIFCDSWDHYSVITDKWTANGIDCAIDLTGTLSRTGIGCLKINSAGFGPILSIGERTKVIVGTAYFSDSVTNQDVIDLLDITTNNQNVRVRLLADGNVQIGRGNDGGPFTVLGVTTGAPFIFSTYNYIEVQVNIAVAPLGSVVLRVNGAQLLNITGVSTITGGSSPWVDTVRLMAAGGLPQCLHDDTYVLDWTLPPNDSFLGAVRIYAQVPFADASPLAWTPSVPGTHFSLVDEIPPNADTDYVSGLLINQVDQYLYNKTGVPAASQVRAVQHTLDAKLDVAGSATIASVVEAITNAASFGLVTNYKMFHTPYDVNPLTGLQWTLADFPARFGPGVTG